MTHPHSCRYLCRDNAGVLRVRSLNRTPSGPGGRGPARVTASLTRVVPGKKLARGDLAVLLVFGTREGRRRRGGVHTRLGYNGAISLKKDGTPTATKVYAPIWLESRWTGHSRVTAMAKFVL